MNQRKMLPGEKKSRRKEAIARKRLERAQDRDGLHIDLFEIARTMLEFAEENVRWREKQDGVSEDHVSDQGPESDVDPTESESSSTSGREEMGDCAKNDVEDEDRGSFSAEKSCSLDKNLECVLDGLVTEVGLIEQESNKPPADLVLDPLSGDHLKAVKKLAGYFRLRWTEQGSGKCRRLILQAKLGPQAPAEINAAENLISKYKRIENGVTTKRLPTARCTPQVSGTQAHFGGWEASTTGFGSRMLAAMGAELSELAAADNSLGAAFTRTAISGGQSAEVSMRRAGIGYGNDA